MAELPTRHWPVCLALGLVACSAERRYIGGDELYQVALTEQTAPALESEDGNLYVVEQRAELPIRQASNAELTALQNGVGRYPNLPFPRLPWVEREDLAVQVDFTLSNLDATSHDVDVMINGANEFYEYVPTVIEADNEPPIPLHAQWERRYRVPAKQRISATVREEELDEVAVDLATVVNGAPNSDEVVYFENNSSDDPRARPYIPAVIPGLIALRLGLRATTAAPLLLEVSIRVRDEGDKLVQDDEAPMQFMPELFESVVPET